MSNQQEKPPLKCLLGIDPEKAQKCKPSECASCGWEAAEAARRREYVKEHGLTLCADGFRRLIIRKEKDMATPYKECHPYSAYERGTNENINKMIRRFLPKGTDFRKVTAAYIQRVETWINNYPREILGFETSGSLFERYVAEAA